MLPCEGLKVLVDVTKKASAEYSSRRSHRERRQRLLFRHRPVRVKCEERLHEVNLEKDGETESSEDTTEHSSVLT
jgi:hypothetical protein